MASKIQAKFQKKIGVRGSQGSRRRERAIGLDYKYLAGCLGGF